MENKLVLNENIKTFLNTDNSQIWSLIVDNKTEDLLTLSAEDVDENILLLVKELLLDKKTDILDGYYLSIIKESNGDIIRNLVRLIFALDINGEYEELLGKIKDKLFDNFPLVIEQIQKETFGYPARPVENYILNEAATIRTALTNLIYYFTIKDDLDSLHFVTVMRTLITLAIMGTYKNIVGNDMVETAKIKEKVGETDAALTFYNGARNNLKNELQWFIDTPEMGPGEEDRTILKVLKDAYEAIDRLNNTSEYTKVCSRIDEVLTREYVEFDFDEVEEDD